MLNFKVDTASPKGNISIIFAYLLSSHMIFLIRFQNWVILVTFNFGLFWPHLEAIENFFAIAHPAMVSGAFWRAHEIFEVYLESKISSS